MKKNLIVVLAFYLLGIFYLILPEPAIPSLPDSFKSTEPGDTGQIPNVIAAYYTNLPREEVINFYKNYFSSTKIFNLEIPLITYKLNHPPEYARETIIDTIHSYFFEELVHPLRESLFINGWIPRKDIGYQKAAEEPVFEFEREGRRYHTKITLYYIQSPIWARILVWTGIIGMGTLLSFITKSILSSPWLKKK